MNEIAYQCTSDRLAKLIKNEKPKTKGEIAILLGFHQSYISMMLNKNHWKNCPAHIWNRVLHWIDMDMKIDLFAEKYPYSNKLGDVRISDGEASDAIEKIKDQPDLTEATEVSEKTVNTENKPAISDNILILIERLNSIDINYADLRKTVVNDLKYLFSKEKELSVNWDLMKVKTKETNIRVAKLEEENIPFAAKTVILGEWQLCPKCIGSGKIPVYLVSEGISIVSCDLCDGKKVIQKPMINQ